MMNMRSLNRTTLLASSVLLSAAAHAQNPFAAHAPNSTKMVCKKGDKQCVANSKAANAKAVKAAEAKCGGVKNTEAKCGGVKNTEAKCGGVKNTEAKCGEAKCGAGN